MFEKEKKEENLINKNDEINTTPKTLLNTKALPNEDFLNNHKDSVKSGEYLSEIESNRISLKNRNSDMSINILVNNNSETTNSNDLSNSHKNLFYKNRFTQKNEDERNKSKPMVEGMGFGNAVKAINLES